MYIRISDATFNWCGFQYHLHSLSVHSHTHGMRMQFFVSNFDSNDTGVNAEESVALNVLFGGLFHAIKSSTKYLWATNANLSNANMLAPVS